MINAYSAHMDSTFWKDPDNFRPERFLDKDNKITNSARVINFGLGMLLLIKFQFQFQFQFQIRNWLGKRKTKPLFVQV